MLIVARNLMLWPGPTSLDLGFVHIFSPNGMLLLAIDTDGRALLINLPRKVFVAWGLGMTNSHGKKFDPLYAATHARAREFSCRPGPGRPPRPG